MADRVRTLLSVSIVTGLICVVGAALLSVLLPDFARPIRETLSAGPPLAVGSSGMNLIIDGGQNAGASNVMAGMRPVIVGALLLGIPLAAAAGLARRRQWEPYWAVLFRAGSVVQISSLGVASLFLFSAIADGGVGFLTEVPAVAAFLLGTIVLSALAFPMWVRLGNAASRAPKRTFPLA